MDHDPSESDSDRQKAPRPRRPVTVGELVQAVAMGLDAAAVVASLTNRDSLATLARLSAVSLRAIARLASSSRR